MGVFCLKQAGALGILCMIDLFTYLSFLPTLICSKIDGNTHYTHIHKYTHIVYCYIKLGYNKNSIKVRGGEMY